MSTESIRKNSDSDPHDQETLAAIIARSKPEDYDGHTEFHRLSPRARLDWLDSAVLFLRNRRALCARKSGNVNPLIRPASAEENRGLMKPRFLDEAPGPSHRPEGMA